MKTGVKDIHSNGLNICIDWLSWTFSESCTLETVFHFMGYPMADFQKLPQGRNGYRSQLWYSAYPISVQYDGQEGMGIHVDVSGSAVPDLIEHYIKAHSSPSPFCGMAYESSDFDSSVFSDMLKGISSCGHLTRIDLAIDDMGARYYTLPSLDAKLSNKFYVSKFRKWRHLVEHENGNDITGYTIYMGSGSSSIMLRIYDKQLEQNKKLKKAGEPLLTSPWVRWELELKNERAIEVCNLFAQGKGINEITVGVLSNYLRIVTPDCTRNSRSSTDPVWESFIGDVLNLSLYCPPKPKTIEDTKNWLDKQVAPSLASVVMSDGGSSDFIHHLLKTGSTRLSAHQKDMVFNALE